MGSSGHTLGRVRGSRPGYFYPAQEAHGASCGQYGSLSTPITVPLPPPCWCLPPRLLPRLLPSQASSICILCILHSPLALPMSPKDRESHTCQPLISARIQLRPRTPSGFFRERAQCRKCFHKRQKKGKKQNTE